MSKRGFMEDFLNSLSLWAAVMDSRDAQGRPDPYRAAGIAYGMRGDLSDPDMMELGGYLGAEGAFESEEYSTGGTMPKKKTPPPQGRRSALDWKALSEAEKQYRIQKAQYTKALHRYWEALWAIGDVRDAPPLDQAEAVWNRVRSETAADDPEQLQQFRRWLKKRHGILMDAEGRMHALSEK